MRSSIGDLEEEAEDIAALRLGLIQVGIVDAGVGPVESRMLQSHMERFRLLQMECSIGKVEQG